MVNILETIFIYCTNNKILKNNLKFVLYTIVSKICRDKLNKNIYDFYTERMKYN